MSFIQRKIPRTRPHTKAIKLNSNHWLAKNLQYWYPSPDSAGHWRDHSIYNRGALTRESGTSPMVPTIHGNNAIDFSTGVSEFAETDIANSLPGSSHFTIGFWAKSDVYFGNAQAAIALAGGTSASTLLLIYPFDAVDGQGVRVFWNGGNRINQNTGGASVDEWHHFVFTVSSAAGIDMYVDAVSVGSSAALSLASNLDSIDIGHWIGGQNYTRLLKDITIHDRRLTSAEVAAWYKPENRWALYAPRTQYIPIGVAAGGPATVVLGQLMLTGVGT